MSAILRKYGESTTINFDLFEVDGIDFRVDAVHASGDTAIMKDEAAEANTTNSFTDEGNGYSLVLTATEMQAARIVIYVVDQTATKVWLDRKIVVESYGHASSQHAFDLDTASVAQSADNDTKISLIPTTAMRGTDSAALASSVAALNDFDPTADTVANVTLVATTTTNTDMRGTDSAALASVCTEPRLAELDAANLPTDVAAIPTTAMRGTDSAATSAKQDTMETTLNAIPTTAMRGTDNAATATNLATIDTNVDSILVDTATTIPALIAALNDLAASDILTTQLSESYAADGAAPTLTQALMLIQQALTEFSYATTLNTVKRLDGSTTAAVMTLDDATSPTSSTRTS